MENATKALLIAAAVLVAILIISLGLVIYNRASETVGTAGDLSEYQIQQFNEKFLRYNGKNIKGTDVNVMLQTVMNHNLAQEDDSTTVEVYHLGQDIGPNDTVIQASTNQTEFPPKVPVNRTYEVRVKINEKTHLVDLIQYYAYGETTEPE